MNNIIQKSRVLVFSTSYFPYVGGAEVAIREVAKRLSSKFDFFIITSRFDKKFPKIESVSEGTVVRLGFGNRLDKYLLPILGFFWAWSKPGILFGLDISIGALATALLKVFQPQRFFVFNIQYGYGDERLARGRFGLLNLAFRFMLQEADYVTAISTYLLNVAKKYGYSGKAEIIPNGVELSEIQNVKHEKRNTIITVSRLVSKNGVDILINAIAEIKKTIPDIRCLILGDGPEEKKLKLQTKNYGLETNIEFVGNVSTTKVYEYLSQSNIFVRLSRSEGMGNAFLEALAAGIPIVGTSVGGIPDIIEDGKTGLFCKSENPKDLTEKILALLKNENLAKSIVENGQQMIKEKFLWDEISKKYEILFNSSLNYKILIVTGIFPPDIGGPATYSKILLEELPKRGIGVRVLSFSSVRHLPKIIRHFIYGIRLMAYGRGVDIIFAQDPVSVGFPAAVVARILRKEFLLKIVGDYAWEQYQQKRGTRFITLENFQNRKFDFFTEARRAVQKFVAKRAKLIIVPSNYLKKIVGMWEINQNKINVIYNAFEPLFAYAQGSKENIKNKLNISGMVIVSAGRLVPWKGFNTLLNVFNELSKKFEDLKLIIIGSGPEEKKLKLMAINYGLSTKITFTGSLSREKVLEYLCIADIFVLNTAYEGFSHQILEAMAFGVPVLTTNIGGNLEIVRDGENGFLVGYNDKKALKEKIIELLENKNLAESFSLNAKITASQFTKEKMIIETIKVLKQP